MTKIYHCSNCNSSFDWQPETCPQCKGTSFYFTTEKGTQWDTAQTRMEEKVETVNTQQQDQKTFASSESAPAGKTKRQEILEQAIQYTTKDRNSSYGGPEDNFKCIADLWSIYLHHKYSQRQQYVLNATDVALMLDLLKTARLIANPNHLDSWIDKAGYSACGGEIATK